MLKPNLSTSSHSIKERPCYSFSSPSKSIKHISTIPDKPRSATWKHSATTLLNRSTLFLFIGLLVLYANAFSSVNVEVHKDQFVIQATPVKRLCNTHNTITVNVQFPGPTLEVNNGDTLEIKIINKAQYNVTIHCSWLRATVYGALIIHRRAGESHQFLNRYKRNTREWWDANPIDVIRQTQKTGHSLSMVNLVICTSAPAKMGVAVEFQQASLGYLSVSGENATQQRHGEASSHLPVSPASPSSTTEREWTSTPRRQFVELGDGQQQQR
nr:laccase-12-like [Ipomoea batatas]